MSEPYVVEVGVIKLGVTSTRNALKMHESSCLGDYAPYFLMAKQSIPDDVKAEVALIIEQFNQEVGQLYQTSYIPRYRDNHLYLDRIDCMGRPGQICQLTYTGNFNSWDFAIYKFSDNRYDPNDWMIPGMEHIDGTISGAMQAGLAAYPP